MKRESFHEIFVSFLFIKPSHILLKQNKIIYFIPVERFVCVCLYVCIIKIVSFQWLYEMMAKQDSWIKINQLNHFALLSGRINCHDSLNTKRKLWKMIIKLIIPSRKLNVWKERWRDRWLSKVIYFRFVIPATSCCPIYCHVQNQMALHRSNFPCSFDECEHSATCYRAYAKLESLPIDECERGLVCK